jgi:molecular chaperone GrpE
MAINDAQQKEAPIETPTDQTTTPENTGCAAQLAQTREQLMYLRADFDNFRRQTEKTRGQLVQQAQLVVWRDMLAIVDDFERAIADGEQRFSADADKAALTGFTLVYKKLLQLLEQHKITLVPTAGQFDPTRHEAIAQVPAGEKPAGTIVDVLQKGYEQLGVIIRPARVTVAQ